MSNFFLSFELQVQRPARGPPDLGNWVTGTANVPHTASEDIDAWRNR